MTLPYPKKKDPQKRTVVPTLPPAMRSRAALGLSVAAAEGRFALQHCGECGAVQYPPRDACHACLSHDLSWKDTKPYGKLLAETRIHASPDPYFRERLPWRMGSVQLKAGPVVLAHLVGVGRGDRVRVDLRLDRAGQGVMVALPEHRSDDMEDDPVLRAMGTHPKHRRVLISDATHPVTRPLIDALFAAGAAHVFAGVPEMWRRPHGLSALDGLENVSLLPLDVTDPQSLKEAASEIGGKVDILINTARHIRPGGVLGHDTTAARDEMEVNALGLMRLAQAFGPGMAGRTADGVNSAAAFVTILSAHALSPDPAYGAFNASQAAARSVAQTLRAEFAPSGLRMACVYTGPTEDEWHQPLPPPKVAPKALARAVVDGLQQGLEDIFCGDVARDLADRWRSDPGLLEREITGGGA
ncbi:Short-chain dehydrogenase [Lutimaribacter pacificus]|uniref:Short-chain dehydrogenase n=1 Tax=Lutimaribacter pacificus TaxID=391948 RepID=A0A1H0HRT0_9RHOB|nr:SDR family NAD(P)-dependent oxidoreductase [Lutimaribacter pacificus]SDO21833.1 Short-chain dehydrogenase [Lutimaribacter pacificus]SHK32019.1 Short-chain dehydrogenase [Lutimaribacter pacificus]